MSVYILAVVGILLGIKLKAELRFNSLSKLSYRFFVPPLCWFHHTTLFQLGAWDFWLGKFGRIDVPLTLFIA